jgi:hypothetical protein
MHTNFLILAEARIGDLHLEADRQRLARQAATPTAPRSAEWSPVWRPSSPRRVQPSQASVGAGACD